MFTDEKTRNQRKKLCDSCPSKNGVRCGECNCFLLFLRKVTGARCPLKRW